MCLPAVPAVPVQSFSSFLGCLDIPPRDGTVAPRLSGGLPCHCAPTKAARKSGRRGFTVTTTGEVKHTRCGKVIARFDGTQFVVETYPEPERQTRTTTAPTPVHIPNPNPVDTDGDSHAAGRDFQSGCSLR